VICLAIKCLFINHYCPYIDPERYISNSHLRSGVPDDAHATGNEEEIVQRPLAPIIQQFAEPNARPQTTGAPRVSTTAARSTTMRPMTTRRITTRGPTTAGMTTARLGTTGAPQGTTAAGAGPTLVVGDIFGKFQSSINDSIAYNTTVATKTDEHDISEPQSTPPLPYALPLTSGQMDNNTTNNSPPGESSISYVPPNSENNNGSNAATTTQIPFWESVSAPEKAGTEYNPYLPKDSTTNAPEENNRLTTTSLPVLETTTEFNPYLPTGEEEKDSGNTNDSATTAAPITIAAPQTETTPEFNPYLPVDEAVPANETAPPYNSYLPTPVETNQTQETAVLGNSAPPVYDGLYSTSNEGASDSPIAHNKSVDNALDTIYNRVNLTMNTDQQSVASTTAPELQNSGGNITEQYPVLNASAPKIIVVNENGTTTEPLAGEQETNLPENNAGNNTGGATATTNSSSASSSESAPKLIMIGKIKQENVHLSVADQTVPLEEAESNNGTLTPDNSFEINSKKQTSTLQGLQQSKPGGENTMFGLYNQQHKEEINYTPTEQSSQNTTSTSPSPSATGESNQNNQSSITYPYPTTQSSSSSNTSTGTSTSSSMAPAIIPVTSTYGSNPAVAADYNPYLPQTQQSPQYPYTTTTGSSYPIAQTTTAQAAPTYYVYYPMQPSDNSTSGQSTSPTQQQQQQQQQPLNPYSTTQSANNESSKSPAVSYDIGIPGQQNAAYVPTQQANKTTAALYPSKSSSSSSSSASSSAAASAGAGAGAGTGAGTSINIDYPKLTDFDFSNTTSVQVPHIIIINGHAAQRPENQTGVTATTFENGLQKVVSPLMLNSTAASNTTFGGAENFNNKPTLTPTNNDRNEPQLHARPQANSTGKMSLVNINFYDYITTQQ